MQTAPAIRVSHVYDPSGGLSLTTGHGGDSDEEDSSDGDGDDET